MIEALTDRVGDLDRTIDNAQFSHSADVYAFGKAASDLSDAIREAPRNLVDELIGAVAVGLGITLLGGIFKMYADGMKMAFEIGAEFEAKKQLLDSLADLEAKFGPLTYEKATTRSYARGMGKEERSDAINGFVFDGILKEYKTRSGWRLHIDTHGEEYIDFHERLSKIRETLDAIGKNQNKET